MKTFKYNTDNVLKPLVIVVFIMSFSINLLLLYLALVGWFTTPYMELMYFFIIYLWVFVVLGFTDRSIRRVAQIAILIPWFLLCIYSIQDIKDGMTIEIALFYSVPFFIWAMKIPGELIIGYVKTKYT